VQQILPVTPTTYRNAAGNLVSLDQCKHVIVKSNSGTVVYGDLTNSVSVPPGRAASLATDFNSGNADISIYADGGTASYTIILIGN